jgi:universal stress protein A
MLPLKKILCPTDFSDPSYEALAVATELAVHFSAELYLLHVATPIPMLPQQMASSFNVKAYHAELTALGITQVEEVIATRVPADVTAHPLVVSGEASDEIVREAKKHQIDLIVMATHGLTGWRRFITGSVTEKIVRLAPCAVMTIRQPKESD